MNGYENRISATNYSHRVQKESADVCSDVFSRDGNMRRLTGALE